MESEIIEIPLSRKKMIWMLLAGVIILAFGLLYVFKPTTGNAILKSPEQKIIGGIICILFSGFLIITMIRKLFNKNSGLSISREGIVDSSSGVSIGLISWKDIKSIKKIELANQKLLMLIVENPQYYLDRIPNPHKRKIMEMNYKNYGSPIIISSSLLQIKFDDLQKLLNEKLEAFQS